MMRQMTAETTPAAMAHPILPVQVPDQRSFEHQSAAVPKTTMLATSRIASVGMASMVAIDRQDKGR